MPSYQISFLMMFVGKCLCTSHVLQYSSCLSYEHSRSPQSFLCSGAVTVLICSFFVAALLILHNFKKRQQIYTLFHNPPNIFQTIFRPKLHIHKVYKKDFRSRGDRHGVTQEEWHMRELLSQSIIKKKMRKIWKLQIKCVSLHTDESSR